MTSIEKNNTKLKGLLNQLKQIQKELQSIADEAQNFYDTIPEQLKRSDTAMESEVALDDIDSVMCDIETVIDDFENRFDLH